MSVAQQPPFDPATDPARTYSRRYVFPSALTRVPQLASPMCPSSPCATTPCSGCAALRSRLHGTTSQPFRRAKKPSVVSHGRRSLSGTLSLVPYAFRPCLRPLSCRSTARRTRRRSPPRMTKSPHRHQQPRAALSRSPLRTCPGSRYRSNRRAIRTRLRLPHAHLAFPPPPRSDRGGSQSSSRPHLFVLRPPRRPFAKPFRPPQDG